MSWCKFSIDTVSLYVQVFRLTVAFNDLFKRFTWTQQENSDCVGEIWHTISPGKDGSVKLLELSEKIGIKRWR